MIIRSLHAVIPACLDGAGLPRFHRAAATMSTSLKWLDMPFPTRRAISGRSSAFASFDLTVGQINERKTGLQTTSDRISSAEAQRTEDLSGWERGGGLVHQSADVHVSARVEAGAVVWNGAKVAAEVMICSGAVVGPGVKIGPRTVIGYNVSLQHCSIGADCILHQGVRVGADGFGFYIDDSDNMVKKPQTMGVVIGDAVEIGANSCVDRGSWRDTTVGPHTKIDNLVQVGHNVVIGHCCIICGQTGLGGSSTLGDYVVLAGQVGVADHVSIVSKVRVAAKSGVSANITKPGDYAGYPTVPAAEWRRQVVFHRRAAKGHGAFPPPDSPA